MAQLDEADGRSYVGAGGVGLDGGTWVVRSPGFVSV